MYTEAKRSHTYVILYKLCQSSADYGNTNKPSMHRRLGSATLPRLAFLVESDMNFP